MERKTKLRKLILLTLSLGSSISLLGNGTAWASHEYDATTNTDTYFNQSITNEWGFKQGDMKSYDHPDRNLVINWTSDSGRTDGAPIRGGNVNAINITINTDFDKKVSCKMNLNS